MPTSRTSEELIKKIASTQLDNGGWRIYPDEEEGNLSATVQAYTALLLSEAYTRSDPAMQKAEAFIDRHGGVTKSHFMTKMMLAVNGLYEYPGYFYFPMTYFLLAPEYAIGLYKCSNYARIHLTPMIICMNKRFAVRHEVDDSYLKKDNSGGWFREDRADWAAYFIEAIKQVALTPLHLHRAGYAAAETFMLERIETNGTLYSYASSTYYMIYALLALGHRSQSPILKNAMRGMEGYAAETYEGLHIQNSPSTVWDTALLSSAIQEAGIAYHDPMAAKANSYLWKKQQLRAGDWKVNAPNANPGGWGFSDINSFIPDNDDTGAALRALARHAQNDEQAESAWRRGLDYLLEMQNKDGGWGAFEKNAYNPILAHLPLENAKDALIDPSTPDLTGRVLHCLGYSAKYRVQQKRIRKAVDWLINGQQQNGSWYGKWGICYIYGTWAAVTGMRAVGVAADHPSLQAAAYWLESIQRDDGGWGESCNSAEKETYVGLDTSTLSQTAWALDALLTIRNPEHTSIQKGVAYLVTHAGSYDRYPTGMGLPGGFYIHYESYNYLFPLLALGHYRLKVEKVKKEKTNL